MNPIYLAAALFLTALPAAAEPDAEFAASLAAPAAALAQDAGRVAAAAADRSAAEQAAPARPLPDYYVGDACRISAAEQFVYGPSREMMITADAVFYYHEDCDICAAISKCDRRTGKMTPLVQAHSVGCGDLAPYRKGEILYDECAPAKKPAAPAADPAGLARCEAAAANEPTYYGAWSLLILSDEGAYYYHEDCDICAAVDRCDLKTGAMSSVKQAHSVGCKDVLPLIKGKIIRTNCR